jgi:uncharacterized small protein (DUF1192 family)
MPVDDDDRVKKPVPHVVGMVIDTLSIHELAARIDLLREEIKRLEAAIEARRKSLDAASSVFKF